MFLFFKKNLSKIKQSIFLLFDFLIIILTLVGGENYGSFSEASVQNSALALFYFAFGLPAFALIKVFSSFFFCKT